MNQLKKCTCCLRGKCLTDFYKKANRIDARCKICVKNGKKDIRKKARKRSLENSKRRLSLKVLDILSFEIIETGTPSSELLHDVFTSFLKEVA